MKESSLLTVACLGAGYFSQFHYEAWNRHPNTQVISSADPIVDKAKNTSARNAYASLQDLLAAEVPDILDIITPPAGHLNAIKEAVKHDIKVIVCQKPFCRSIDEAKEAATLAHTANIPLVVHENFRFQPWFRVMKDALDNNLIGQTLQLTFRLRTGDGQGQDAYLERQPYFRTMPRLLMHETGVHYIDTFHYLLGSANHIYADLRTLNPVIKGEDAGLVIFGYEDGRRAILDGNRLLDHNSKNTRITFGEASLEGTHGEINLTGNGEVSLRKFGATARTILLEARSWPGFAGDCVYALQDHIVSALIQNTPLENSASDYLRIMAQVDTVYQAAEKGVRMSLNT